MSNRIFNLPFKAILTLSWRNLWRNHRRTAIMLAAISVGVWAMIFMTAIMRGMVGDMLSEGIRNLPGHIQIHQQGFADDPSIVNSLPSPDAELLSALNHPDTKAWSGRIKVPAVISSERDTRGVMLLGVDPIAEDAVTEIAGQVVEGRFLDSVYDKGVVIGLKLAERLETRLGKRIVIMTQDSDNNIADRGFRIVGLYKAKLEALEEKNVYAARGTLQGLLNIGDRITEIAIIDTDMNDIEPLYLKIKAATPAGLEVRPWYEIDVYLSTMLATMDGFVLVWIIIVFLALSFGLVNTLLMAVFERTREIGLIQALGMRPSMIIYQIVLESVLLLVIGLGVGNALAVITILPLESGLDISAVAEGLAMFGAGAVLYPTLLLDDVILANVVVILLGTLTSILPAWRAARLNPVQAINST
ncbi:MAG: ABC transporter permease [Gammaproteobacteria bacterium]|nr:ABC transporter permease [Gammaproteobacteria bacterium]MCZ6798050.1 ABC transporter permease [Gammaproteobacteria bacterium]MCZ6882710.1 ABC transporter permease [Gammaproteobacteria bacterium]